MKSINSIKGLIRKVAGGILIAMATGLVGILAYLLANA
jgi:hypothetical protein